MLINSLTGILLPSSPVLLLVIEKVLSLKKVLSPIPKLNSPCLKLLASLKESPPIVVKLVNVSNVLV